MRTEIGKREIYAIWMVLYVAALFAACGVATAQTTKDHAVLVEMKRTLGQFGVTWPRDTVPTTYIVRVRSSASQDWQPFDTLTNESEYLHVIPPSLDFAEVEVEKRNVGADGLPINAFGYYLGHGTGDMTRWQRPGRVLLVIDSEARSALRDELDVWTADARREGWIVQTLSVSPDNASNTDYVLNDIADIYADPTSGAPLTHVFLIGNVPYAYSGGFKLSGPVVQPDGHEDHGGAWSSDARYAELETSPGVSSAEHWTDLTVNITGSGAVRTQNKNVPGDGKYDQSQIPTDAELAIGRLDMRNLPAFGTSASSRDREFALMRSYFARVHAYRVKETQFDTSARIDDNFGVFTSQDARYRLPEAFAAGAWRGFSAIVGSDNVAFGEIFDTIPNLLAYGCGGGGFEHCDGVANAGEFASRPIRSAFLWMFGSYFADVDSEDNIMRAALANDGDVLTCGWSGRPYWVLHPLAAQHTLGEVARTSINNAGIYHSATIYTKATGKAEDYAYGQRGIHINLLGDPTLRMPAPVMTGSLTIEEVGNDTTKLEWDAISDAMSFIIEAGKSLDQPMSIVGSFGTTKPTPRVSKSLVLPPGSRYVRVRPIFGTIRESSFTPILGRGLMGFRDVSSVAFEGAAHSASGCVAHYADGTIVIEGATCSPTTAGIYDLTGRLLSPLTFHPNGLEYRADSPLPLRPGLYFIRNFEAVPGQASATFSLTLCIL